MRKRECPTENNADEPQEADSGKTGWHTPNRSSHFSWSDSPRHQTNPSNQTNQIAYRFVGLKRINQVKKANEQDLSDLFRIVQFFATPNNSSRSSRPKINVCVSSQPKTILKDMHFCVSKLALLSGNSGTFARQNGHFVNHAPHHAHATSTVTHSLTTGMKTYSTG